MKKQYPIESYDKYLCLKLNDVLWLSLLFLLRPYVVILISVVNRADRAGVINMVYADKLALWWGLLAGVPAVLVIYAWSRKKPGASLFIRRLWHNGRLILAVGAVMNVVIVFIPVWTGAIYRIAPSGWIQLAVSVAIIVALYTSSYVRDCFADFPKEEGGDGAR